MKRNWKGKVKRIMAGLLAACLLLTWLNVSSVPGIRPLGDLEEERIHKE